MIAQRKVRKWAEAYKSALLNDSKFSSDLDSYIKEVLVHYFKISLQKVKPSAWREKSALHNRDELEGV